MHRLRRRGQHLEAMVAAEVAVPDRAAPGVGVRKPELDPVGTRSHRDFEGGGADGRGELELLHPTFGPEPDRTADRPARAAAGGHAGRLVLNPETPPRDARAALIGGSVGQKAEQRQVGPRRLMLREARGEIEARVPVRVDHEVRRTSIGRSGQAARRGSAQRSAAVVLVELGRSAEPDEERRCSRPRERHRQHLARFHLQGPEVGVFADGERADEVFVHRLVGFFDWLGAIRSLSTAEGDEGETRESDVLHADSVGLSAAPLSHIVGHVPTTFRARGQEIVGHNGSHWRFRQIARTYRPACRNLLSQ